MSASDAIHLVISIAKLVRQFYASIEECKELGVKCLIVQIILEKNANAFSDDVSIQQLVAHLQECARYLHNRQTKSFFRNMGAAILFPKRITGYKEQIDQWISLATFSLVVGVAASTVGKGGHTGLEDPLTMATYLQSLPGGKTSADQRAKLLEQLPRILETDLVLGDALADGTHASLKTTGDKVKLIKMSLKSWDAPKLVQIYATLSGSVSIQRLFGILQVSPTASYAVMEDLEESPFLPLTEGFERLAATPFIQRLRICYDLALTVAVLHNTNRVIKVLSDSSIYLRDDNGHLTPVLANLADSRLALSQTTNSSYDQRYNAPECETMNQHNYKTDIWSLGAVLWQILQAKSLPLEFDYNTILEEFKDENDPRITLLVSGCLERQPSSRPTAAQVEQLFSDQYADASAKVEASGISALLEKGRTTIEACRAGISLPISVFSKSETSQLLAFENSWDDSPSTANGESSGSYLRLAPQVKFLLGAGILWGMIDVEHVHVRATVVSRGTTSLKVYRNKIAIYYLTESIELGFHDASRELAQAHAFLEKWYLNEGEDDLAQPR